MVDIVATLASELAIGSDTPAPINLGGGGAAANTAAWLVAAGATATLFARIGDDALGHLAHDQLVEAGVDARLVVDPAAVTGSCIVLVDVSGERTMIPDAGANTHLAPADLDASAFTAGRHLHLSAYSLFHHGQAAALHALALARAQGMTISVDAASSAPLEAFGAQRFTDLVGAGILLFANLAEARVLAGVADPHDCATQLGDRFGAAVIKLGAGGALWSEGVAVVQAGTVAIDRTDTTGAGDAFAAGLLSARLAGARPLPALHAGNELAAQACRRPGGRP
jgi:ribokinase